MLRALRSRYSRRSMDGDAHGGFVVHGVVREATFYLPSARARRAMVSVAARGRRKPAALAAPGGSVEADWPPASAVAPP